MISELRDVPPLSKEEALNLAAWLAVVADPGGEEFDRLLNDVKK